MGRREQGIRVGVEVNTVIPDEGDYDITTDKCLWERAQ